jgi:hypothetical protein
MSPTTAKFWRMEPRRKCTTATAGGLCMTLLALGGGCSQTKARGDTEKQRDDTPAAAPTAAPAATSPSPAGGPASEVTWKHPRMAMRFSYPNQLLTVRHKPDGAVLTSEILGTIEDRSGRKPDAPAAFEIVISVRQGELLGVMKANPAVQMDSLFPDGTEASFREQKGYADRIATAGATGYRIRMGSHEVHIELVYAPLAAGSVLEVTCNYVGDMARPKVTVSEQERACKRVLATLALDR